MIVSASRRTDLPAFYAKWLVRRFEEGYALVRNPFRFHQVEKVLLNPEHVDGIVFWTKNPAPLLPYLKRFERYPYYFQYTLTSYGRDLEPGIPKKGACGVETFQKLSEHIGKERIIWRYDPILVSERYCLLWHLEYFERLARKLEGYTTQCTISFLDLYPSIAGRMDALLVRPPNEREVQYLAKGLAQIAHTYGMRMQTCAEQMELEEYGIAHGKCVDAELLSRIAGKPVCAGKGAAQRPGCGCAPSVDIGAYGACHGECQYCYARRGSRAKMHLPDSPLLLGRLAQEDVVRERK